MDTAGISRQAYDDLGSRLVRRGSVFLDEVRIPTDQEFGVSQDLLTLVCVGAADTRPEALARGR
jgi:hypothetical protein